MKKTWEEPKIMVQKFVANEYVAACGDGHVVYNFECNAGKPYTHYAVKDSKGDVATISGKSMDGILSYYTPCGETHQAESDSGFLEGYHLDYPWTREDENIKVVIWTNNNTDVHCTTQLVMKEWTTAKS